ncbi:MAG: NosD domain-containing protein, partial [Candidatus Bilamarchaeum sp.]
MSLLRVILLISFASVILFAASPTVSNLSLNTTLGTNFTNENLTAYWNATDLDNDPVYNITNWYVNNFSILVFNMPFEGGSNSTFTKDYSPYGNNGSVNGATWNATGGYDGFGAYEFDGVDDYIDLPYALDSVENLSIEMYVKPNTPSSSSYILFYNGNPSGDGYGLILGNGGCGPGLELNLLIGAINCNGFGTSPTLQVGQWSHIVLTKEGTTWNLYLNGSLLVTASNPFNSPTPFMMIGQNTLALNSAFNGSIDNFKIYNRSLSQEQISALFANRTDRIVSRETLAGQNWSVCITPNDGIEDGTTECSDNVSLSEPIVSQCQMISIPGHYELNQSLSGAPFSVGYLQLACIQINSSDVDLNCNGFSITNNGTVGNTNAVYVDVGNDNVTTSDCVLSQYTSGYYSYASSNMQVLNNSINQITNGIVFYGANGIIANNSIDNGTGMGIFLDGNFGNYVMDNNITNMNLGIEAYSDTAHNIWRNNIENITSDGILSFFYSSQGNIANNTVQNASNCFSLADTLTNGSNLLYNNTAINCTAGFVLSGNNNNTLRLNQAINSSQYGFLINYSNSTELHNNLVTNYSDHGVFIIDSYYANITSNNFSAFYYGIFAVNTSLSNFSNNQILDCSGGIANIGLVNGSQVRIINNTISGCYYGIDAYSSYQTSIIMNNISNVQHGVYVEGISNESNVSENLVSNASGSCFGVIDGVYNSVLSNNASGCGHGVSIYYANFTQTRSNVLQNISGYGVLLDHAGWNTVQYNTVHNTSTAFYIFDLEGANLSSNNISNSEYGIHFLFSNGGGIYSNIATNNTFGLLLENSNGTNSSLNILANNTFGSSLNASNLTFMISDHYYNNSVDLRINNSQNESVILNLSKVVFDNPNGNLENFTNMSLNDSIDDLSSYEINWSNNVSTLPNSHLSFNDKYVRMTNSSPDVSIDSLAWHWTDNESSNFSEDNIVVYMYSSSAWSSVGSSTSSSANTLTVSNLILSNSDSVFALLEAPASSSTPSASTSGSGSSPTPALRISLDMQCNNNTITTSVSSVSVNVIDENTGSSVYSGTTDSDG